MEGQCTDAALSRKQRVFACIEGQHGQLRFPIPEDAIRPAGDATMTQAPSYTDSSEKFDTLDLLDKFPNSMPPGEWLIPMYVRMSGFGSAPQGLDLFEGALGRKGMEASAELAEDADAGDTGIVLTAVSGDISPVGVIKIGNEIIRYGRYDKATGSLLDCVRGYHDTVPEEHAEGEAVMWLSSLYLLDTCPPTLSIWIETDHVIQFMSGCVVEESTVPVQNADGLKMTFKGRGMAMGWAGKSVVQTDAPAGVAVVQVAAPKRYTEGARVYNKTKNDFGTFGYEVLEVRQATGELVLAAGIAQDWDAGDEVSGYLPPADIGGEALLSRDTVVLMNGVPGKVTSTNLTIGTPVEFLEEVGTRFPEEYAPKVRNITMNLDTILRRTSVDLFKEGYDGIGIELLLTMGSVPGQKVSFFMPRVKSTVPIQQFGGPAVTLQIQGTALGKVDGAQVGENSICIIFE